MRASLLVASLGTLVPILAFADSQVPALMAQAQRAYIGHDDATAKELFEEVLQIDSQNTLAIQYLRNIRIRDAGLPTPAAKSPLQSLMIDKIQFKDAGFSAALDFLKAEAEKHSVSVSFVSELPQAQMDHPVTLNLNNIPFLEALRYLCELNNAVYKVQPYAIVIQPIAPGAPTPAAASVAQ